MEAGAAHPATGGMRGSCHVHRLDTSEIPHAKDGECSSGCIGSAKTGLQAVPVPGQAEPHPPGWGEEEETQHTRSLSCGRCGATMGVLERGASACTSTFREMSPCTTVPAALAQMFSGQFSLPVAVSG